MYTHHSAVKLDEDVRHLERGKKAKIKEESTLTEGFKVLRKLQPMNKWTNPFESQSHEVSDKCGKNVYGRNEEMERYKKDNLRGT